MDAILLLVKNHLKGKIPEMLNSKDNQVFLDYLAGGQSRQVAMEREANGQSGGVLSVAARNLAFEQGGNLMDDGDVAMKEIQDVKNELQVMASLAREVRGLPDTFKEIRKEFSELEEVKLSYAKKDHEQKLQFKQEEAEFEVKKRKQNMQLLLEEAEVEQRCKAIREGRIDVVTDGNSSNKRPRVMNGQEEEDIGSIPAAHPYMDIHSICSSSSDDDDDSSDSSFSSSSSSSGGESDCDGDDAAKEAVQKNEEEEEEDPWKYDYSKEEGMSEEEIKERHAAWNRLADMHNQPNNDMWLEMLETTGVRRAYEQQLLQRLAKYEEEEKNFNKDTKAAKRAYVRMELKNSQERLKQFRTCQYLELGRKVLGEEAWEDCVGGCEASEDDNDTRGNAVNWTNMEVKLFGINVHAAAKLDKGNWKVRCGRAQHELKQMQSLEELILTSPTQGLKDKLKMARWRFGTHVARAMQRRMREMHVRRQLLEMTKI